MSGRFHHLELVESPPIETMVGPTGRVADRYLQEAHTRELEGSFEPALRKFSAALREDTALDAAWCGQIRCLVQLEEYPESMVWGKKACAVLPTSQSTRSAWAYALARSGMPDEALTTSDEAFNLVQSEPGPYLWLERAACLMADQRWTPAEACLDKVGETRVDPDWQQRKAAELLFFERSESAVSVLNDILAARPERAYAWLLLARGYRQMGDAPRFRRALNKASQLSPFWGEIAKERSRGVGLPRWMSRFVGWMKG